MTRVWKRIWLYLGSANNSDRVMQMVQLVSFQTVVKNFVRSAFTII